MIPKIIHYCWFGEGGKSDDILDCLESWKKTCPDFEIKEWNELNFPVEKYHYASRMYNEKKWALVSDFARLEILYDHGGIYLDTDMFLVQSLEPLTVADCALGEMTPGGIGGGMVASEKHHPFIHDVKKVYDDNPREDLDISQVLTTIYQEYPAKNKILIYPPKTFYPFDPLHIKDFHEQKMGPDVIGVHLWHYSWQSGFTKFFKRFFRRFKRSKK